MTTSSPSNTQPLKTRIKVNDILHSPDSGQSLVGTTVTVKGWIRTIRKQKAFSFIEINDGSSLKGLQAVIDASVSDYETTIDNASTGAAISVQGTIVESPAKGQSVELKVEEARIIGTCDATTYPLQKKRHSFEFLRGIAHLRPRTNTIAAIARIRNALSYATHLFFQEKGFCYINTPIITASDCEGAGELFQVSTLDMNKVPMTDEGQVDYSQDFFSKPAFLTVSGQLGGEVYALALSDVYTFGPTFRAENSNTSRHLAEFWMIEPEMAFADLQDNMNCAEEYLKYVLRYTLDKCENDLALFNQFIKKGIVEDLQKVVDTPFQRITYTEAISILEKSDQKFEFPVKWGVDLQSEHERYLTEKHFKAPVILTDYPKNIKAFYMRDNDDGKTVAAMDVLVPGVGEIIGGAQREERIDILEKKLVDNNLDKEDYWWYLELRKYGSVPHAGFGLGLERLVQFCTGMENIRDVIPFPRYPGHAEF